MFPQWSELEREEGGREIGRWGKQGGGEEERRGGIEQKSSRRVGEGSGKEKKGEGREGEE